MGAALRERFASVEELLTAARRDLDRLQPAQAVRAASRGALLVDIRPAAQLPTSANVTPAGQFVS